MDFISNFTLAQNLELLDGTTPLEVYCVTFFVPVCSLLISTSTSKLNYSNKKKDWIEIISINLVLLLALTLFCNDLLPFFMSLFMIVCTLLLYIMYTQVTQEELQKIKKSIFKVNALEDFNEKFIGDYRGHLLLATSICILAVDFAVFPVRFSKTETYGWSVMDAGVGSFVLVHGLCSSSARRSTIRKNSLKKCMLSSFPLFMLGFIRLSVTRAVGYHKVVPEYGVHWNFFFTLALTKVLCYFIETCFFFIQPGILALATLIIHQVLLSKGLTAFVLSDLRRNFLEANKEGICSLLGFVSIYFFGVELGKILWKKRNAVFDYIYLLLKIIILGALGWSLMYVIHLHVQPVSRRMTNFAYCIWVVTLTSLQIAIHLAYHIICFLINQAFKKDSANCLLWKAINYNGLFYFLLANVFTGVVNLTIKTENYDNVPSFLILVLYLTVLTIPTIFFYEKSIQFKCW